MNKFYGIIFMALFSTQVSAKVTEADVTRDMNNLANQNHFVTQAQINYQWDHFNRPPNEVNNTRQYQMYSRTCVDFRNSEIVLKPISGYTCALSKIGGNYRGYMEVANIIQSGGYWRLKMTCGGTDIYATAMCWNK